MERAGREVEVDEGHHPQKKAAAALACCLSWPWPRIRGGPCGPALGGSAQKKVEESPCIYIYIFIYLFIYLFICFYIYWFIYSFIFLFIYLYIHTYCVYPNYMLVTSHPIYGMHFDLDLKIPIPSQQGGWNHEEIWDYRRFTIKYVLFIKLLWNHVCEI